MGGRGSNINAQWRRVFQPIGGGGLGGAGGVAGAAGVQPPNVTPGQPVPTITQAQLQAMNNTEFVNYLNGLKSTPLQPNIYYNHDWDTQRLIANMPELNRAPQVVDAKTFASLPGQTLYRTVNQQGNQSATDICGRTMASDVTTIGAGVFGDGFYFSISKSSSQTFYGEYRNDIRRTATMQVKLNQNARTIDSRSLENMLSNESYSVQQAVRGMSSGGTWGGSRSGYMAYALKKGYNVIIRSGSTYDIIDRNAATWSNEVVPWT